MKANRESVNYCQVINRGATASLSIIESLLLYSYVKDIELPIGITQHERRTLLEGLERAGMFEIEDYLSGDMYPSRAAIALFNEKKSNLELANKLRLMYPAGMKDGKWSWRSTANVISSRLDDFNKMYPDITNDEIIAATERYLKRFTEEMGRSLLMYFIWKEKGGTKVSLLADFVLMDRETNLTDQQSTFSQI